MPVPAPTARRLQLLSGLLLLALTAGGAAPQPAQPLKGAEVLPESDALRPGEALRFAVRVTLSEGYHVNSHTPSEEYLIPTTLEFLALDGLDAGGLDFPEGAKRKFTFSETELSVYEGSFLIRGSLKAPPDAAPAERRVRLALRYQACTAQRCYPPKKEEIAFPVRIAAKGTPLRSLHPDLFAAPRP